MTVRKLFAAGLILLGLVSAVALRDLGVDNRLERWMGPRGEETRIYREFRETFGSDEFILVAVWGRPLFEADQLDLMVAVLGALEAVEGVVAVDGLPTVYRDVFGSEDPTELEDEFTSTPFYEGLFLSHDWNVAGLLVAVEPPDDPASRGRIVDGVRRATAPLEAAGLTVRMVGSPVLAATLDQVSRREALRTFPIAFALSMAILGWMIRSLRGMVVAAVCAGLSVLLTLGVMVVTGFPLSMITSVLPSLLWVLALANSIHILQSYQRHRLHMGGTDAIMVALTEMGRPCTLAAVTTALGFASLLMASVVPVREVGVFAAIGIMIALGVNLTVGPALISWLRVPVRKTAVTGWWSKAEMGRPRLVLAATAVFILCAGISLLWVPVESNPLSFLPRNSGLVQAYSDVGERLTGSYTMEVVVTTPDVWWDPQCLVSLNRLEEQLNSSPIVPVVVSPLDLIRKASHWQSGFDPAAYGLPDSRAQGDGLMAALDADGRRAMERFAAGDGRTVRLSAVVDDMDDGRFLDLVDSAESMLGELPDGYDGRVTGMVLRLVKAQQHLVASQVRSLLGAFVVVFLAIAVGLGSWRLMVLSIVPNLVPVLTVFGLMSGLRIPLDAATVMVASVALGIAVDNTVHLLSAYQIERHKGLAGWTAVRGALNRVGVALVVTTATACAGFLSLGLSAFVPIRDFGLLAAAAMLVALAADLYVVPAMLVVAEDS